MNPLDLIDPLNFSVARLRTFYDQTQLGIATGFFVHSLIDGRPSIWVATNWHVVTGRNADTPSVPLFGKGSLPNRIKVSLPLRFDQPEYKNVTDGQFLMDDLEIALYDDNGLALWYQNQRKNEIDIAVFNLGSTVDRLHTVCVNQISNAFDMKIQAGSRVLILGYPLGFSHFAETPIWTRLNSIRTLP
jgi:hypothetical protein